ncbi:MAG: DUF378 domain-containing protein [Patescibacteria group bacterium]
MCNCHKNWAGCTISIVAKVLVIVGGLNWGLVGLGMLLTGDGWNVVNMLLGSIPTLESIVYLLVGIAALGSIFGCKCKKCMEGCGACSTGGNM